MVNFLSDGANEVLKTKISRVLLLLLAPVLSGALLFLAFPTYDLEWLAWVGLVPLLIAISGRSLKHGFFLSLISGIIFFAWIFDWMFEVTGYTFLHHAILFLYLGFYFGLFGLAFAFLCKRSGVRTALLVAPFIWVSLEYFRSNMGFMAHPWAWLAHSQYQNPIIIQIASVTGAYGVSFLIVMINSALAAMVLALLYKLRKNESLSSKPISKGGAITVIGTAVLLTTFTLFYGLMTLSKPIDREGVRVTVVQGNIEQRKKWDRRYAKFIMETYADLTREASKDRPALIIWPEAATPRAISRDPILYGKVRRIASEAGTYLLLGSTQHRKFRGKVSKELKYRNSALLISPDRSAKNQGYDKTRLVPFGEYLPMKKTIPWSYLKIPDPGSYVPGKESTVFEGPGFRFGVNICWEVVFPDLFSEFVKRGAQFMVNISNEAWFGKTVAPYLMLSMSVFRAVENRIFLVRSANTGVSCFIDPYGRIVNRVKDKTGQDLFVRGILTETVIPMKSRTIYNRYGDLLAWLSLACSAIFLIKAFLRKNPYGRL